MNRHQGPTSGNRGRRRSKGRQWLRVRERAPNNSMQRTALRAAADAGRQASRIGMVMAPYQVFVSFKNLDGHGNPTPDSVLAATVSGFLASHGLRVFFSNQSLEKLGTAAYKKAIDDALDACSVLVAVGTSANNLQSPWVQYEWDSFYNDLLSGLWPHKRLFSYVKDIVPRDPPRSLRQNQSIVHIDATDASLTSLLNFVRNALPEDGSGPQAAAQDLTDETIASLSLVERLALGILCWDTETPDVLHESILPLWHSLPRLARRAYSDYADQVIDQFGALGYDLVPTDDRSSVFRLTPDQVEALAGYEHMEWLARKAAFGWQYGGWMDKPNKRSPFLAPWSDLPDRAKQLALTDVRSLPVALAAAWLRL